MTECTQTSFTFADHCHRQVVARFDGGTISSDGGAVLLHQLEQRSGIVRQFADWGLRPPTCTIQISVRPDCRMDRQGRGMTSAR